MNELHQNRVKDAFLWIVSQILRYFPIRHEVGIIAIGNPDSTSPVFISGDYFCTVKRVIKYLKGHDCYLLIVDSAGINVWCAAGVCDINEHKIADAVNASGIKDIVKHRTIILPQLVAVGIDKKKLYQECGFQTLWGPANIDDIGVFIDNNCQATDHMRLIRFALKDRLSLALGQLFNYFFFFLFYFLYVSMFGPHLNYYAKFIAIILFYTISITVFIQYLPFKWPPSNVMFASIFPIVGIMIYAFWISPSSRIYLPFYLISTAVITLFICMDMVGSTVFFKSTVSHWIKTRTNRSLFQPVVTDKCIQCGECTKVCPKGLFSANGSSIQLDLANECCECLACVRQCPVVAIKNINKGYFKHDIKCIPDAIISEVMY